MAFKMLMFHSLPIATILKRRLVPFDVIDDFKVYEDELHVISWSFVMACFDNGQRAIVIIYYLHSPLWTKTLCSILEVTRTWAKGINILISRIVGSQTMTIHILFYAQVSKNAMLNCSILIWVEISSHKCNAADSKKFVNIPPSVVEGMPHRKTQTGLRNASVLETT